MDGTLDLSQSLRGRGHEVIFAGMPDCGPIVTPHGYRFTAIFEDQFPPGFMSQWMRGNTVFRSWQERLRFYLDERRKMIDHEAFIEYLVRGGFQDFNRIIEKIGPDVILVDLGLHAYWALLAYQTGIKYVYVSTTLPTVEDTGTPPFYCLLLPPQDQRSAQKVRRAWNRYFVQRWFRNKCFSLLGIPDSIAHIRQLARACGYPLNRLNTRTLQFPILDADVLVMCPREFEFPQVHVPARRRYVNAYIHCKRVEPSFPFEKIEADKKIIFTSLGSIAYNKSFFQHVIDAVTREHGWQLIMNIGPSLRPADFERVPGNAILVGKAPQIALLRQADVMINHGGIGSVKECIYFGVPQIVFPIGFDQPGAAMRVLYHGLGLVGNFRQADQESIYSLLRQVLGNESFKVRSQAMSERFQAYDRDHVGALAVESFIATQAGSGAAKATLCET